MPTEFLSDGIWPEITRAVRAAQRPCHVAVAYFSEGASRQLPLLAGSRLVVNASESVVKRGETCPADLNKLHNRGVRIFSEPKLHAKVFVVGKTAFIGSANVSRNSANYWKEAVVRTTDPGVVKAAREFVESLHYIELGPEALEQLNKIYQPPTGFGVPGGTGSKRTPRKKSNNPTLPRLFLAQLQDVDYSEEEQECSDQGFEAGKKYRKHPRSWIQEEFIWTRKNPYQRGDVIIQVYEDNKKKVLVTPPATVYHVEPPQKIGRRQVSFVYLERPDRRRKPLRSVAEALGCPMKDLRKDQQIKNRDFTMNLLDVLGEDASLLTRS